LVTPADNSPFALSVTITEKLKEAQRWGLLYLLFCLNFDHSSLILFQLGS
jgi:hypothetical protein